jgi:choline dehydrogenase
LTGYEYIIIGSGAGGGPVAARLALAGHKTLLIEAGDDQGANVNYTVPAYQAKSTEDPALSWDFYVRHYEDDARQALDYKLTYNTPDGTEYTGLDPPSGSTIKGVLYPRTGTLGGCTAHNALVSVYPDQSDFNNIAKLTGDASWESANIRKYFVKMEKNNYLAPLAPGHGYSGWLGISEAPLTLALDPKILAMLTGAALALGNVTRTIINLATALLGDPNADSVVRDQTPALYQMPISTQGGQRNGIRDFLVSVANAKDSSGKKKYPLDIRMNCFATKVTFDTTVSPPKANGVEFLDGEHLYRASPLSRNAAAGTPGSATASREVIVSGGSYK